MHDIQLPKDSGRIVRQDHLLQVVDDDFVAAVGAEGALDCLGYGAAGVDVAQDGAVFGVVAVVILEAVRVLGGS